MTVLLRTLATGLDAMMPARSMNEPCFDEARGVVITEWTHAADPDPIRDPGPPGAPGLASIGSLPRPGPSAAT